MVAVSETQFRLRKMQLGRRREIGELSDWEYRYLLQGLRACMTGKAGVSDVWRGPGKSHYGNPCAYFSDIRPVPRVLPWGRLSLPQALECTRLMKCNSSSN